MSKFLAKVFTTLFILAVTVFPLLAQDAEEDKIVCDSALIVLLFIAENDYGYSTMESNANISKGQFNEAFEIMMDMMMDDDEMMDDEDMSDDEMMDDEDMSDDEMMDDEDMSDDEMMDDDMMMSSLELPTVADEDPACTALRTELVDYFTHVINGGMMMDDMESSE